MHIKSRTKKLIHGMLVEIAANRKKGGGGGSGSCIYMYYIWRSVEFGI